MTHSKWLATFFGLFLTILAASIAQAQSSNANPKAFGKGHPLQVTHLPASGLRDRLLALDPHARANAMRRLKDLVFTSNDLPYIKVDAEGGIFFADDFGPEPAEKYDSYMLPPVGNALTEAQTFLLHSRPGAPNVIYLDFDGHTFTDTAWSQPTTSYPDPPSTFYGPAYDISNDDSVVTTACPNAPSVTVNFSTTELDRIHEIWHRIAEDYAPFDVDVTTEEPAVFDRYTGRILFTTDTDYCGRDMPAKGAGGVAYVGVFGDSSYHTYTSPALVYNTNIIGAAEAGSHEMGHNLSLGHDGHSGGSYYYGHGSGYTSWGPIMGAVYSRHVSQWSKGDYAAFVQAWSGSYYQQDLDDLKWIDCRFALVHGGPNCDITDVIPIDGLGYAADDHADSVAAGATLLEVLGDGTITVTNPETDPGNSTPANKGIIGDRDDVDYFYFDAGAGDLSIRVTPAWDAFWSSGYRGANLDIYAELYDSTEALVTSDGPSDETDAILTVTGASAGRYYLAIDGEGCASGCSHEGYDDYASIGQYFISGTVPPASDDQDPPGPAPTFASGPTAVDAFSMTMTSTPATDETGPVEYQFNCTTGGAGCTTSAWQTSTTYLATGLTPNTTYWWQVRARDQVPNVTAYSATSSAKTPDVAPAAPSGVGATPASQTRINLSWTDNSDNETSFVVLHSSDGASYSPEATLAANVTTYSDTGLATATTHWYKVYATNAVGDSAEAGPVSATTWDSPPAAPSGLTATANGAFQVDLAWSDNANNETGFEIWRSTNGTDFSLRTTEAANATSWSDTGLTSSTQYWYKVLATNTGGDSAFSNTDSATTAMTPPNAPSSLSATTVSNAQIDLAWTDNSNDETGFEVWRSTDGTNFSLRTTETANTTSWSDTGLASITQYWYKVLAMNTGGDSGYSNTANDTTFEGCSVSKTYTGGEWYQFALACNPGPQNTVAQVFDGPLPLVYRWDANTMAYIRLGPSDVMTPQIGYWVNFYYTTSYTQSGYPISNADIPLVTNSASGRSNLVGFHGTGSISWPDTRVIDGPQVKTLLEADPLDKQSPNRVCDLPTPTSKCLMSRILHVWGGTKAAGSYQVYDPDVPGQEGTVVPLDGLWVKAFKSGVELRLPDPIAPAPGATESAAVNTKTKDNPGKGNKGGKKDPKNSDATWYVRLIAEQGSMRDPGNTLGQKPGSIDGRDSRDLEEPAPFGDTYLSILFTNPLFGNVDWGFTTDFRTPTDSPLGEWPFVVRTSNSSAPISLSWASNDLDFSSAWLVNQQSGARIAISAGESYTFQPTGKESHFVFVIE